MTSTVTFDPDGPDRAICEEIRWTWLPPVLVVCAAVAFLSLDEPAGAYFSKQPVAGELRQFLSAAEHVGTPWGQLLALGGVAAATGWSDRRGVRIFLGATAGGVAANVFKLMVARTRPRAFDFDTLSLSDGFTQWFPFGAGGSAYQSLPSGHTASAFAFACLLTWAYPRGRTMFLVLACLAAMQRVASAAHFPSDVLLGGALGWLVGLTFIHWQPLARFFTRLERVPLEVPATRN